MESYTFSESRPKTQLENQFFYAYQTSQGLIALLRIR